MNLSQWLLFEERLRKAPDIETLQMITVNLLQHVFPYTQAILFEKTFQGYKTTAASHISEINEYSATIQWLNQQLYPLLNQKYQKPVFFATDEFAIDIDPYYRLLRFGLFIPLSSRIIGECGIIFWFKEPQSKELLEFAPIIAHALTHSWEKLFLQKQSRRLSFSYFKKKNFLVGLVIFLVVFFIFPIKQSTIAFAEISPKKPILIAPSINGTISTIEVKPNQEVAAEQVLFKLDDIVVRSQLEEAQQAFNVAKQRYLKAYRHAYTNEESRQQMQILAEEQQQALVTYQYHVQLLERAQIKSPQAGIVLYSDPKDWLGKPVKIGEKVMLVANPKEKEITFWITMDNMIDVDVKTPIRFFSNANPTHSTKAYVEYINPIAESRPDGIVAYFGVARLAEENSLRLGEQGTIKLFGKRVSIIYYLLRRPIRYLRQQMGI